MRDTLNLPTTRTWRDIPQPVVPRAMSREGRWRFVMAGLRIAAMVALGLILGWGAWMVMMTVDENAHAMPAAAKATPMKAPELHTDGVLDDAWLTRTLALPKNTSLVELDLGALRARLMADRQVINATLTKHFPDRLIVQLSERSPVARVMTRWMGQERRLLAARDGVLYEGTGYKEALLDTLPWLAGVKITPDGANFKPIAGMDVAAELLAKAQLEAQDLYASWGVISLAKLDSDHKIQVQTKNGCTVYFSTNDDFFHQLARLDYIAEQLGRVPGATATIDLTLGTDVPVRVTPPAETDPAAKPGAATAAAKPVAVQRRAVPPMTFELGGRAPATVHVEQTLFTLPQPQPTRTNREF